MKKRYLVISALFFGINGFAIAFLLASVAVSNCGLSGLELTLYKVLCLVLVPMFAGLALSMYSLRG